MASDVRNVAYYYVSLRRGGIVEQGSQRDAALVVGAVHAAGCFDGHAEIAIESAFQAKFYTRVACGRSAELHARPVIFGRRRRRRAKGCWCCCPAIVGDDLQPRPGRCRDQEQFLAEACGRARGPVDAEH